MKKKYNPKNKDIFVSTVTENLIESCNIFSKKFNKRIILISSLNQVSTYKHSYLYNDISLLNKKIHKFKNKNIFLGRDHFGINSIKNFNIRNKLLFLKKNLINDLNNNISFIHLDFAKDLNILENFKKFTEIIMPRNNKIIIEIGLDEDGVKTKIDKFLKLQDLSKKYKKNIKIITYQTGSKLFNNMNKARLSYKEIEETITDKFNIYYKEHNCDFKHKNHFKKLNNFNFLFNIGPEFAYYENITFCKLIEKYLNKNDYEKLYNEVINKKLWIKWCSKNNNKKEKIFSSLHYFYNDMLFRDVKEKLVIKKEDYNNVVINNHIKLMKNKFIF